MSIVRSGRWTHKYAPAERFGALRTGLFAVLIGLGSMPAWGQMSSASNLRIRWYQLPNDTLVLDSLSTVPGSLHLFAEGLPIGATRYELDPYRHVSFGRIALRRTPSSFATG